MCRRSKNGRLQDEVQRQRTSRMRTRIFATLSFLLYTISLIINFRCLFHGNGASFTWDSRMVNINTSLLGSELLSTKSSKFLSIGTSPDSSDSAKPLTDQATISELSLNSGNNTADFQSAELGIRQWYSFDVLFICEGSYCPSPIHPDAKVNVSSCIYRTPFTLFNFTAHLQQELRTGTLNATLTDLNWPLGMQGALNKSTGYLEATLITIVFSIILLLSIIIPSAIMACRTAAYASLSSKMCFLASIIVCLALSSATAATAYLSKTVSVIDTLGNSIGISASQGYHYSVFLWTNVALATLAFIIWGFETYFKNKEDRKQRIVLHQEHYERARMWGKIGALEGEEPMCSCVDPWKVMGHRRGGGDCGDKGMPQSGMMKARGEVRESEDIWRGVDEKVLVMGK